MRFDTKFRITDIVFSKKHIERYKELEPLMITGIHINLEEGPVEITYSFEVGSQKQKEEDLLKYDEAIEFMALEIKKAFLQANKIYPK